MAMMHHAAATSTMSSNRLHFSTPEACVGSPVALSLSSAAGNLHFFARNNSTSPSTAGSTSGSTRHQPDRGNSTRCQCNRSSSSSNRVDNVGEDAILSMKSIAARKLEEQLKDDDHDDAVDWESWQKYFTKVDEEAGLIMALKFQIEDAVKSEDYQEAAKLKAALEAAKCSDTILEINKELQKALEEERYSDAARLRDAAGSGLIGWWAGKSKDGSDPVGLILNIKTSHGKLVAEGYSARQLATSAAGVPLFEVYIRKWDDERFSSQAVYLHKKGRPDTVGDISIDEIVEQVVKATEEMNIEEKSSEGKTTQKTEAEEKPETKRTDETSSETKSKSEVTDSGKAKSAEETNKARKGISDIVNFLKDRIPELGMRVIRVVAPETTPDASVPKMVDENDQKQQQDERKDETEEDEPSVVVDVLESSPETADPQELTETGASVVRVVIGGASPSNDEDHGRAPVTKLPAVIEHTSKNSFELYIESMPATNEATVPSSWKIAKVATIAAADQMPKDVAKMLWNVDKVPIQSSKEAKGILKLRLRQALGAHKLSERTSFQRIDVGHPTDPFTGVYIGTFGANFPEVLQINRKYGHWDSKNAAHLKFYEYVEAVKLTGDVNVPAGQVSFRAKIGRENRLSPYGVYPEELGVIARYKGEGQLADEGFKNPKWTEGELVLLDGKTRLGPTNGARLGFVFCRPDHHFLILFDKLNFT